MSIKKIQFTKEPSFKQFLVMATNLREKYNCFASVECDARHYAHTDKKDKASYEFVIYLSTGQDYKHFNNYEEFKVAYLNLIEKDSSGV
jgi:hypothetical protein